MIDTYHAHIYFDLIDRKHAEQLRREIESKFEVVMGRWWDKPIGPHPKAMYQVAFNSNIFAVLVPWLLWKRGGLTILVHSNSKSGNYFDHTQGAMWLGCSLKLNLSQFAEEEGIVFK